MRTTLTAVLIAIAAAAAASAGDRPASTPPPHLRPLTGASAELLDDAVARSPSLRKLVEELQGGDVVVYLTDSMDGCHPRLRACLTFVAYAAGTRYLQVHVARWLAAPWERVAWLGHELQHAIEIAAAPEVKDAASMAAFYERIGWRCGGRRFESGQARATGDRVREELFHAFH